MLTEEKINLNYANFVSELKKYGVYTESFENDSDFNEKLKNATAFIKSESGGAYAGSLVEHITRIAVLAFKINGELAEEVKANVDSLIKVCYLHQISKALLFVKNEVEWEVKKGKQFTFAEKHPALKTGEYSAYLCNNVFGIKFTEEEFEAILSVDKRDDLQAIIFASPLSKILNSAIDLAESERRARYNYYSNTEE